MKPVAFIRTSPERRDRAQAQDGYTPPLSLDEYCVQHPTATFFVRVGEDVHALDELDVHTGDVLVVDRAVAPHAASLVLAVSAGEFCLGRYGQLERGADTLLWGTVIALARTLQ